VILAIDPDAASPPYDQLRTQLAEMITAGTLPVGHRLPAIRQLATDLGLAPGTVARAYGELERQGLIRTRRGRHGSVVVEPPAPLADSDRDREATDAARRFAVRARQLGVHREDALRYAERALADVFPEAAGDGAQGR
jgi:DNA-binding transcriptional regulator YhcF (GntR family)